MSNQQNNKYIKEQINQNRIKLLSSVGMQGYRAEHGVSIVSYVELDTGREFLGIMGFPDQPDWISQGLIDRFVRQFDGLTIDPTEVFGVSGAERFMDDDDNDEDGGASV